MTFFLISTSCIRALQAVATCRQSPYLHKPAIVVVTSFSLWRHSLLSWSRPALWTNVRTYGHRVLYVKMQKKKMVVHGMKPIICNQTETWITRMWANAQRDSRPAEYRWRPLFNATKLGWRPLLDATIRVSCSNAAKMRNPLKFAGVPKTRQYLDLSH